jgi:hydrogenase nickel incorporation protein HypA/HybF
MHEYSITSSIINILEDIVKKNNLSSVKKVKFELSPISNIEPESIRFYYDFLTKDNSRLKGAKLMFSVIDFKLECRKCGKLFRSKELLPVCPACGSRMIKVRESDDIRIISVEA